MSGPFRSDIVDRVRETGNVWRLPGGQLVLPRVFGFCRGVERALEMLEAACDRNAASGRRLILLGEIIHNPWVNEHFRSRGVRILSPDDIEDLPRLLSTDDFAVIPAFGIRPEVRRRLEKVGCQIIDTSCGDVRRLWGWALRSAREGFGVLIFGRPDHDETIVTKGLLAEAGGRYVVAATVEQVRRFCELIEHGAGSDPSAASAVFTASFGPQTTNADSIEPFLRLAQVSQTTMLYERTLQVRELIQSAFVGRFGMDEATLRLSFQPTVCQATQDRQNAAVEMCQSGYDLVVVVGGFGSSNTRHLWELARQYSSAWFIEGADAIRSREEIEAFDPAAGAAAIHRDWLPGHRGVTIGVLAGASTPESVVGEVLRKLADFLR